MMNKNRCCNDIVIEFENEEELNVDFTNETTISREHDKLLHLDYEEAGHTGFMPSRLSLLNNIDPSTTNNNINLLASVDDEPSKLNVDDLRKRIIRTSNEVPTDLQVGQYLFLEKGDNNNGN